MVREPLLKPVSIDELRPTQITVGMQEVAAKRKEWRSRDKKSDDRAAAFLGRHMIPVVLGPKDRAYVTDHHHLARALHEEGVPHVLTTVISDLSSIRTRSGSSLTIAAGCIRSTIAASDRVTRRSRNRSPV